MEKKKGNTTTTTIDNISTLPAIKNGIYVKFLKGSNLIEGRVGRCFTHNVLKREEFTLKTKDNKVIYVTEPKFGDIKQIGMITIPGLNPPVKDLKPAKAVKPNPLGEIDKKINELIAISNKEDKDYDQLTVLMLNQEGLKADLTKLAREANTMVGRTLQFSVADGYAWYVITKVNAKTVSLQWIDYCDGYMDRALGAGKSSLKIKEAKSIVGFEDTLLKMSK